VHDGKSIQVVSAWGVGSTTLFAALIRQLQNEDYAVLSVEGRFYSRDINFFALSQSLGAPPHNKYSATFSSVFEQALAALRARSLSAIVIDSLEHLDRGTLAVLQAVADKANTPIILSRSRDIRSLISAGSGFSRFAGQRLELTPLDFVGTAALIQDQLGQWPDSEVASRVFAKSGGVTGLASVIVAGAVANDLISLVDDRWVMKARDLRSGEADSWIESRLALLSADEFDALGKLATAGRVVVADLNPTTLRALDSVGLLARVIQSGETHLVAHPPIVAEYFRRAFDVDSMRSARDGLGKLKRQRLNGTGASETVADSASLPTSVMALRKSLEAKVLGHAKAWSRSPTVESALPYLVALRDVPSAERTVGSVFENTSLSTSKSWEEALDFAAVYWIWTGGKPENQTLELTFADVRKLYPKWERAIAAFTSLSATGPFLDEAEIESSNPGDEAVSSLYRASISFEYLMRGNLVAAQRWIQGVSPSQHVVREDLRVNVESLMILANRDYVGAVESSRLGIEAAHAELDHRRVLLHSYVQALSLMALSRWEEANVVVSSALAFGPPGTTNGSLYRALLYIGAFVRLWLGDPVGAERFVAEAERMDVQEMRLPGTQDEFSTILRALLEGSTEDAALGIGNLSERLSAGGSQLAAELTLNLGLMIWPTERLLDQLEAVLMATGNSYSRRVHEIARQSFTDLKGAAGSSSEFLAGYDDPAALAFLSQILAARIKQENWSGSDVVGDVYDSLENLAQHLPHGAVADDRPTAVDERASLTKLTRRESQIALLVRTYSNATIASRLGVSVRTVENHVRSAMRKRGASDRQALYEATNG